MKDSYTEKRASLRIPAEITVRFSCENLLHTVFYGTVDNISEKGMLITTDRCFSKNTDIRLFMYKEKILLVNATVKRVVKVNGRDAAMGIEVAHPNPEYAAFVNDLKASTA
jgi:hypothetical protein